MTAHGKEPKIQYCGFTGVIDTASATRIASALNTAVNNAYDEIYLCISSTGGMVADGMYLYNHIRGLPIKTTVHNTGIVASIATVAFVAGDRRLSSQHGRFMIHPTDMGAHATSVAKQLRSRLEYALAGDEDTDNILRNRTSIPEKKLTARRFDDVHISSKQALEFGLVHEICDFRLPLGFQIYQI